MIKKHSLVWLVALFVFGAFITAARASDDDCNDNLTDTELHQKIILTATADAPAGAIGKADLEVENEHGVSRAEFEIETKGLLLGDYTVTITNKSGSDIYELGTISVVAEVPEHEEDIKRAGGYMKDDLEDDEIDDDDCGNNQSIEDEDDFDCNDNTTESENNFTLPEGLVLTDLGVISIADSNSIEVLTGSFDNSPNPSQKRFSARASLVPGIAGPDVSGQAVMRATNMKNKQSRKFSLIARKAPANTTLHFTVNGNGVGTIKTNKKGMVILRRLPWVNLATVKSIVAVDPNGNTVFSANF